MRRDGLLLASGLGVFFLALSASWVRQFQLPQTAETASAWLAWWAAALLVVWLIMSVTAWWAALATESESLTIAAKRLSLPGARQLAERCLVTSLLLLPACSVATSEAPPTLQLLAEGVQPPAPQVPPQQPAITAPEIVPPDINPPEITPPRAPQASEEIATNDATAIAEAIAEFQRTIETPDAATSNPSLDAFKAPHVHVVERGDHLWGIAHNTLEQRLERHPTNGEIASYWRKLIQDNRATLASGNPNLIYPGEVITLPA